MIFVKKIIISLRYNNNLLLVTEKLEAFDIPCLFFHT